MAELILWKAGQKLLQLSLPESSLTIGREPTNRLVIHSPDVSRRHARILYQEGRFVFEDLESANGSFLGKRRIDSHVLAHGDQIQLADHRIEFLDPDPISIEDLDLDELGIGPEADGDESRLRDQTIVFDLSSQDLHTTLFGSGDFARGAAGEDERARRARNDRLEALFEITQAAGGTQDLGSTLRAMLDRAIAIMNAERGFLMMREGEVGELRVHVARDRTGRDVDGVEREAVSRTLLRRAVETGNPVLVMDAQADEWDVQSILAHRIHSALCAPFKTRGHVTGVLYVDSRTTPNVFTNEDVAFFSTFALQAKAVIDSSRAYWELVDSLFSASDDFVAVCSLAGRLTEVNRAGPALLGFPRDRLLHKHLSELVPEAERDQADRLLRDTLLRGTASGREMSLVRAEGHPVPMSVSSFCMRDRSGDPRGVCLIGRDQSMTKFLIHQLERRNEFIQKTFGRYLSDEVVENILQSSGGARLGGEKRKVTILMADLRGFTQLSERLPPDDVVVMLNNYLGKMAQIILEHHGTIDEFIGDAILAIFGAPELRPDDAQRAAACAVAMQLAMPLVNERNAIDGLPRVEMGIGLNTGEVVVGNIGSHQRTKYGVVGSTINTTSRIESFTIGGQILISEECLKAAGADVLMGRTMSVRAKGYKQPITVHELLGIGGGYQRFLPAQREIWVLLDEPVRIRYSILEGKHEVDSLVEAEIAGISPRAVLLRCPAALALLENIRLEVLDATGAITASDIYAKVTEVDALEPGTYAVRLTSMPPAAQAWYETLLA